jgi:hypothetical protein
MSFGYFRENRSRIMSLVSRKKYYRYLDRIKKERLNGRDCT